MSQAQAQPTALSPEQVADLYMGALVNDDAAKAAQLNAYLGAGPDGKPVADIDALRKRTADAAAKIAAALKQVVPPQLQGKAEPVLDTFAKSIIAASLRSQCQATSSAIVPDPTEPDRFVATVQYACTLPDAQAALAKAQAQVGDVGMDKATPEQFAQVFKGAGDALDAAPLGRQVTGELVLSAGKEQTDWAAFAAEDVVKTVVGGVMAEMQTP